MAPAPEEEAPSGSIIAAAEHPTTTTKKWSKDEDAVLREQVRLHGGPQDWESISAALPGRTARSCRQRWFHHLAPAAAAAGRPFTAEEDAVIVACYSVLSSDKWSSIARLLPGRTDVDIKNRCDTVLRKQLEELELERQKQHHQEAPPVGGGGGQGDETLPLFPLVAGDVRATRARGRRGAGLRSYPPYGEAVGVGEDDQSGACLALFPLAPGDLTKGGDSASKAAAMDVDVGAGDLLEMRLWPASTAMAAFRAMVRAVRAP